MALSIKSEEADQLTRELARLTGESMTEALLLEWPKPNERTAKRGA
jgi:hypothetical protein